jgi:hypothetical protein
MSFPVNPTSGQIAVVNNIVYSYNSSGTGYWTRVAANTSTLAITVASLNIANTSSSTSTTTGALIVSGGVGIGGNINFGGDLYQNGVLFTGSSATNFLVSGVSSNTPRYLTFVSTTTGYATAETTSTGLLYVANRGMAIGTSTITATADPMAFTGNFSSGKVLDIYGALYIRQVRTGAGAGINPANYLGQGIYDSTTYINAGGTNNNFIWQINGGQKMYLSNAGYFGIGTSPISDLHLQGSQFRHNDVSGWNTYTFTVLPGVVQLASTASISIQSANVSITSTASSTGTTTGALQVVGGVGIGGAVYIGTSSYIAGAQIITTATIGLYAAASSATTGTTTTFVISNLTSATSTSTGALQVTGGAGIGGAVYIGTSSYIAGAQIITTATIGNYASAGASGISNTGTTSTFTILSTANSFSTSTGALQVRGGAGIAGNVYVGGALNVAGVSTLTGSLYASTIYDIGDTSNNTYWQGTGTSRIVGISARNSSLFPSGDTQIGTISVTRSAINSTNTGTYYGLYNRANSFAAGIGVDYQDNFWVGLVTSGEASTRVSNFFYSDKFGNVYAGNSFRSNVFYSANNSAYFLDLITTATNHTILSNAVSTNLIGYDPALGVYIGGTDNRYLTNGTTSSGGPLWVMTGTTYNLIHSGNISQYAGASSTTTFTNPVIIRLNTVDTIGSTASTHLTLINPNTGAASSGIYWRFANQSEIRASLRVNDSGDIIHNSLSGNYRFQQDSGSSATNFLNSTTSFMSVDGAGNVTHTKSVTATKLIDYDDNAYYLDPNSTSTINQLTLKGLFTATVTGTAGTWTDVVLATSNQGGTYITANRPAVSTGDVGYKWSTGNSAIWTNYLPATDPYTLTWGLLGVKQFTMNSAGNMSTQVAGAAIGSPQFYDANNSSYYIKPSGYSYLNSLNLGGSITGISTGTGIRVFNNGSNSFTSTVFWGVPTLNYYWNWQTDAGGNAALWGYPFNNASNRVLTVTPSGNWGFNQSSLPGDVDMIGGISVTGTGTTQVSVMKGSTSGFSLRVSDAVFGDFSLYDKAQGSWKLAINARQGSVGINTTATTAYGLNVGGDINIGGNIYQNGSPFGTNVSTGTFSANQYAWYQNTGTGISFTQNNAFETAAIFGADHVLGSGSLYDLLAWNFPDKTESFGNISGWQLDSVTDVKPLFNGQNSLISVANNYTLTGLSKQGVRFTWNNFSNRYWDALLITSNTAGVALDVTIESSTDGTTWTTSVNRATIGFTAVTGMHYLRNQANNATAGQYFRLTIRETTGSATAVNLFNISLLGTKGAANRLLEWDNQRNITTYGNLTTKVVYDTNNTAYYLSPSKTSNLFTATLTGDLLTQGQGRFTGWQNNASTATRTAGLGVEVGINSGAATISAYNRTSGSYDTLGIYGSPIKIIPQTTASVYIGGQWIDNDDPRYYVKPATGTVITNLKAFGVVEVVNTGGTNYNQNIRLPRAADGFSMISMAVSSTASIGNVLGQWNLAVQPTTGGINQGQFNILNGSTASFSIATATSTATFAANVFAPKYLQVGADQNFFIQQGQTSYLNALKVGAIGASFDVLTKGPLDDYANTFTYVHTSMGNIGDPFRDFNTSTLSYASYVGSFQANANMPVSTNNWYTLYQAAHRGGSDPGGPDYSSQIALPMTSADSRDYTRMFFRVKNNTSWKSWSEVFTVGANNQSQGYTIYAKTLYDYNDTRFSITPSSTSTLLNLNIYGSISGYLSGTPTATSSGLIGPPDTRIPALPRLGSAEWVYPVAVSTATVGISTGSNWFNRIIYRNGLYTWKTNSAVAGQTPGTIGPSGATINPYFSAVGFGDGTGAVEIAGYLMPGGTDSQQSQGLYFRTLRDNGSTPWARWTEILNTATHGYATVLDQNLRITDSPTFAGLSLTNAPTFKQVNASSYWVTTLGDTNRAKIMIPYSATSYLGIGPWYKDNSPLAASDLQSFRFDQVDASGQSPSYQSAYQGSAAVCIYVGSNKIIGSSGGEAWHTTIAGLTNTAYYLKLTAGDISKLGGAEFKNGITLTGDNISANQSARLGLTPGRGIWDASYSTSTTSLQGTFGNVATFGPGLGGYDGYVIGGNSTSYDASFLKQSAGHEFALRGGGSHWALWANGADSNGIRRMSLNNNVAGLINSAYSVSVGGTLYCTQNIYAFSDRRKKTNIATIDNALSKVLQLRGVYYHRTDPEPEDVGRREVGVIAQEVLEILPEAVKHSSHTDEYSVNYGNMAGIFIEAIKDLKKELDELKAELNMLKGNK